jgi:tryptophan-rich sensory protein
MADYHWKNIGALLSFIFAVALVAGMGSFFTAPNVEQMYQNIQKPSWAPPGRLFGPVWSVLYVLIALAGWRIWIHREMHAINVPMILYISQLVLNGLWTLIYFEFKMPLLAFVEISILFIVIVVSAIMFWRLSKFATCCMVPYAVWVAFAAILNLQIVQLNT